MNKKMSKKLMFFGLLIIIIVYLNFEFKIVDQHDINQLIEFHQWIESRGLLAPVLFIVIYGLSQCIFLPNPFFMIVGGLAFGPLWGILFVLTGFSLGAGSSFIIARYLAKNTIEHWLEKKDIATKFKSWFDQHGYRLLLTTRFIFIIPVNIQNYAYGLTEIDFLTYLILSTVATAPKIILLTGISGMLVEFRFEALLEEHLLSLIGLLFLVGLIYFIIYKFFWVGQIDFDKKI